MAVALVSGVMRSRSLAALLVGLSACAVEASEPPGASDAPEPRRPPTEAPPIPEAPPAEDGTVALSHARELRGAWISVVYNGTWPSKTGLTEAAAKAELVAIFDALAGARMNAVFFQVRPESDAVYASPLEPFSRFLTGTQGQDPGWDPLAFAIEEGHRRGLEVHAWLNPYRGMTSTKVTAAPSHVTRTLSQATRTYGTQLWMDPGAPEVRAHILDVVRDILTRYDVDGLHFDDYFYPYPIAGQVFDDAATYAAYTNAGGALAKDDWRRSNVDALIRETSELVAASRGDVRFGVSPFGIYRPGMPPGITGLDAFAAIYCDPVKWMDEGWVDYLAPQLYWPTTQAPQAFGKLLSWWADLTKGSARSIFVGHDATKAGEGAFTLGEYDAEMTLASEARDRGVRGSIFFSASPLVSDQAGLRTALAETHWAAPASTPPLATAAAEPPGPAPELTTEGDAVVVRAGAGVRSVAIYREGGDGALALDRLVPGTNGELRVPLSPGGWAVSTVDRRGVESRALRVGF